jgi:hypothetical protein
MPQVSQIHIKHGLAGPGRKGDGDSKYDFVDRIRRPNTGGNRGEGHPRTVPRSLDHSLRRHGACGVPGTDGTTSYLFVCGLDLQKKYLPGNPALSNPLPKGAIRVLLVWPPVTLTLASLDSGAGASYLCLYVQICIRAGVSNETEQVEPLRSLLVLVLQHTQKKIE